MEPCCQGLDVLTLTVILASLHRSVLPDTTNQYTFTQVFFMPSNSSPGDSGLVGTWDRVELGFKLPTSLSAVDKIGYRYSGVNIPRQAMHEWWWLCGGGTRIPGAGRGEPRAGPPTPVS
jgi:hypothetical protein